MITVGTVNFISNFIRIIRSASVPYEGQSEKVEKCMFLQQIFAFVLFTYLWVQLAYIGKDPIRGTPIEVSKQDSLTVPADHGQAYWMAHYLLYTFVLVH